MDANTYESPLVLRYASAEMCQIFSPHNRAMLWRKLWVALAKAEHKAGLPISREQIDQLAKHVEKIDFAKVQSYESQLRHDVMAHIHAYGDQCPLAKPIIHLGATSAFVTDNGDLLQMREGLRLLQDKLALIIRQLSSFADQYHDLPCLAYTHLQAAQPTTVGKRACLWLQDFLLDLADFNYRLSHLRFLGVKGATGSQASLLELCQEDAAKVKAIEYEVAKEMELQPCFLITSQTYARKQDVFIFDLLKGVATSAHKFATDIRLLAHLQEIEEPCGDKQIGSSAMPYKRNPMLSERICSLSRFVIALAENGPYTAALQWLERSLDDSANRRLSIPEAFLATDAVMNLLIRVTKDLVVYPKVIERNLKEELPFMATENILMACVKKGGDRQILHEKLRQHCLEASQRIKQEGAANDLLERIAKDSVFGLNAKELTTLIEVQRFMGLAAQQVKEFLVEEVAPALMQHQKTPKQIHAPEL